MLNKTEKEIFDFYTSTYILPMTLGMVCPDFSGKDSTKNQKIPYITYALGFNRSNDEDKNIKLRKSLISSAKYLPLQLLTEVGYTLYIRSIEYKKIEGQETVSIRLAVENTKVPLIEGV